MNNAGIRPKTQIEEEAAEQNERERTKIHTFGFFEPRIHFEFRIRNNCALFHQPVGDKETYHTPPHFEFLNENENEMFFFFLFLALIDK